MSELKKEVIKYLILNEPVGEIADAVISDKFNTCRSNIGSIKRGITWSHVKI